MFAYLWHDPIYVQNMRVNYLRHLTISLFLGDNDGSTANNKRNFLIEYIGMLLKFQWNYSRVVK